MSFLTTDDDNPRILTRGTTQTFRVGFFTDGSKAVPLIPKDPLVYPSYEILDISGIAIQSGVLQQDGGLGEYSTTWTVPNDATLSNPNQRYEFRAFIITNTNEQAEITNQFDVVDTEVTATEDRSQVFLVLSGCEFRVMIRCTSRIDLDNFGSLSLQIVRGDTTNNVFLPIAPGGSGDIVTLEAGQITEVPDGDSFIYFYDLRPGLLEDNCQFIALWQILQNSVSTKETQFQVIRSVTGQILNMSVQLRQLIDKFQKQRGRVQAYEDSDLVEYLDRGLEVINTIHPFTNFQLSFIAGSQFTAFVLLASAWYGLNAQYLMEVDLGFAFSGQTVTLDYDHAPMLAEAINRFKDFLDSNVSPAKVAFVRASTPVGVFAGKPMGFRALHRFTFPLQSFQSGDIIQTLSNIGIL